MGIRPSCVLATLAGLILGACGSSPDGGPKRESVAGNRPPDAARALQGRVVSMSGAPVAGARVVVGDQAVRSDARGYFRVDASAPSWVSVSRSGFLPRTRAAFPGESLLVRLTPDDGRTIAVTFGGDVMFGRRFYGGGPKPTPYLTPSSTPSEHARLLEDVEPLLEAADVTVVNLETPLIRRPYYGTGRPRRFHQTKEFAFASAPASAYALRQTGVDVVGLANNHLYDALGTGIAQTLQTLDRAGFQHGAGTFGAGNSERQAWKPAVVRSKGQSLAITGCTSIEGYEHRIPYVATPEQGGAAACDEDRIRRTVSRLRRRHDAVVMMVHGGYEYVRRPSKRVRRYSAAARLAGATLVINHHPHVVGGLRRDKRSLTAWTLGNLLFDQTVWPTFQSYLLTVHLREGEIVRAYTEPLGLEDYTPRAIGGRLAEHVAREAAGREPGPFVMEHGSVELDVAGAAKTTQREEVIGSRGRGRTFEVMRGWAVTGVSPSAGARLGRDLLWLGSFEDDDIDDDDTAEAMWELGAAGTVSPAGAYSGRNGLVMTRSFLDRAAAVAAPRHRLLLEGGRRVTVLGRFRGSANARARVRLSLYADTKGRSFARRFIRLRGRERWRGFRLDVTVPRRTVAIGLYLKLDPPAEGEARAGFDDLRVVQWARPRGRPSALHQYIEPRGPVRIALANRRLPGGPAPAPEQLSDVTGR